METKKPEIKQIQWFDSRYYRIDFGNNRIEYYPSVTTKLNAEAKPFLARWRGDIGNREADIRMRESADRGSRIHYGWYLMTTKGAVIYNPFQNPNYTKEQIKEIESKANGILILENQDEMYDLYKLQEWHKIVQPKIEASELIVYSEKNKEAGQLDKLMYIKDGKYKIYGATELHIPEGLYVVDLKTGRTMPESAFMQIAAYAACYMVMSQQSVQGGIVIHTGAKTKKGIAGLATYVKTVDELKEDIAKYRAVAKVYELNFADNKPKIFEFPSLIKL